MRTIGHKQPQISPQFCTPMILGFGFSRRVDLTQRSFLSFCLQSRKTQPCDRPIACARSAWPIVPSSVREIVRWIDKRWGESTRTSK